MLDGKFALFGVAIAATPELAARSQADAQRAAEAVAPWGNGRHYLNFTESAVDTASGYDEASFARLQALRAEIDPAGLMVANHAVPGASALPVALPTQR